MHLALLELAAARGRFALMGCVVLLVAALVGIVSGFTTGLGDDTVSALRALPATHLVFSSDARTDQFSRSLVDARTVHAWQTRRGPRIDATPLGVTITRGTSGRGVEADLAAIGVEPGAFTAPAPARGRPLTAGTPNGLVISRTLADDGLRIGDTFTIDRLGITLRVTGITGRLAYGHVPAAYLDLTTWQRIRFGVPGTAADPRAAPPAQYTGIALRAHGTAATAAIAATDRRLGTRTVPVADSYRAAPGYSGERVTMTSIQVFLFLIAPLVVGAFFAVWTVQRRPELALLRAMGASRLRLLAHTLVQAGIVVVAGALLGGGLALLAGALLGSAVPFSLPAATLAATMAAVAAVGLAGTVFTLRRVTSADPMTMLGATR